MLPTRSLWWEAPLTAAAGQELQAPMAHYWHHENYSSLSSELQDEDGGRKQKCQCSTSITSGASVTIISQPLPKHRDSCQSNTQNRDAQTPVSSWRAELPRVRMLTGIADETATTAWVSLDVIKYSVNTQCIPEISSVLGSFPWYMHCCWKWMTSFINICFTKYLIHFGCVYVLCTATAINQWAGKPISQKRHILDGYWTALI